ncbi:MAG: LysM peptidoglycan-binding domain-containing protein [Myxococcota bacterium]
MRRSHLFSAVLAVLVTPTLAVAEAQSDSTEAAKTAAGDDLSWEQFEDPDFNPSTASPAVAVSATNESPASNLNSIALQEGSSVSAPSGIVLGPAGIDDEGRSGRLHTVAKGDTLWDLSAAYLGTPWVWPSVWTDNDDIDNPHLILPNDKIWITASEMRVVSDAEAEAFLSAVPAASDPVAFETAGDLPAAFDGDEPSTLDAFPVSVTAQTTANLGAGRQITVSRRDAMGFVSADRMEGASTIVDSPDEKTWLAEGDKVYLGMGEGDVEVGQQFTIFETVEEVRDLDSNRILGHHVNILGWMEVQELTGDTSVGEIRMSFAEIERGAKVVVREAAPRRVTVQTTPDAIEGEVVFLPSQRSTMADGGYVYLNRGEFHGVEVGSELEVYERGQIKRETTRGVDVQTPSRSVATLVVVSVDADSAVAFVLSSSREISVGDAVRPALGRLAQR